MGLEGWEKVLPPLVAIVLAIVTRQVFLSLFLMRRAYAVFGAVGLTMYLGHLAWDVFKDSILFPFALSAVGVALIAFGLLFHKYGKALRMLTSFL